MSDVETTTRPEPVEPVFAVALVASAGGLQAISRVLGGLPDDFGAAVIVVLHLLPDHRSHLSELLGRHTGLAVKPAEDGDSLTAGHVYVAPPGVHLLLASDRHLRLGTGPPVHYVRPSADVLLTSLAEVYQGGCVAVVLSGSGSDGADGVKAVKAAGGHVLVQDPSSSEHRGMPAAAVATGAADGILSLAEMAPAITALVSKSGS